jgi:hypothetical protein
MIDEIAQFLEDHTTKTIGVDLFVGYRPAETATGGAVPKRHTLILENGGSALEPDWPDYMEKGIQIWNEAPTFKQARADAYEFYNFIHVTASKSAWDLPVLTSEEEYRANSVEAVDVPRPIENPGADKIFKFSTNYIFRITRL